MKLILIISATIILVMISISSPANSDSIADNIFKLIYNEQYEKAEKALEQMNGQLDPFYKDIFKIDLYWWEYIKSNKNEENKQLSEQINILEHSDNSPGGKIRQLVAKSYKIRYQLKRYNIIGATVARSEIKSLLEEIKKDELKYSNNRLELFNIYNALYEYFDNLINPFFLDKKRLNRQNAINQIEKYTNSDDLIAQTIATYFLGKIFLSIENEPEKGRICFKQLSDKFPQNSFFNTLMNECIEKINPTDSSGYNPD